MIQEKIYKQNSSINTLLKEVLIITLLATIFLVGVGRFGGYFSDYLTKKSCKAINETYIEGELPGEGICVKSSNNMNIKK